MYQRIILTAALAASGINAQAIEVSGNFALEYRLFVQQPLLPTQGNDNVSFSAQPQLYQKFDNGDSIAFTSFTRVDENDESRTHSDIREFYWSTIAQTWELRMGIRKVFWGVTESQHLVDIINQTDGVENPDGEDKLGQPMVNFAYIMPDLGTVDFFVMPYFRERNFTSKNGRLWPFPQGVDLDDKNALYQSDKKQKHVDYAMRWVKTIGDWDLALSQFYGTSRDPDFQVVSASPAGVTLAPYYALIHQTGIEAQATLEDLLLKLELISRRLPNTRYTAATLGLERTYVGIMESVIDMGLVAEYSFDDRSFTADEKEPSIFANDLAFGTRFTFNDVESSDLLALIMLDLDGRGRGVVVEGSRRVQEKWKVNIQARYVYGVQERDLLYPIRKDGNIQAEMQYYF